MSDFNQVEAGGIVAYALGLAAAHPDATAVGIATTGPADDYSCMAAATVQHDRHGQPWTPRRLAATFGRSPRLLRRALEHAAVRAVADAHRQLRAALDQ